MGRLIQIYLFYFKINIKKLLVYRSDFIFNLISVTIWIAAGFFNITILFSNTHSLGNWGYNEVGLLYGMWALTFAVYNFFGNGILDIEDYIISGKLDILFLRPINPLLQIVCSRLNTMGLGFLVIGIVLVAVFSSGCAISWSLPLIIYFVAATLSGGLLIFGTYLALGSLAFWFLRSNAAIKIGYDLHKFAQYPLSIYGKPIKILLICIFPYAFTNYYPVLFILGKTKMIYGLSSPLICMAGFLLSLSIWRAGIKKYEGSGS